jgi:hypothetical protein
MKNVEYKTELTLVRYSNQKFALHSSFIIRYSAFQYVV